MYKPFYGLARSPFNLSPDPEFLTVLPHTREALAGLEYGIASRKGILVLTGEVGTGKTVLLRATLARFSKQGVHFAYVFNPRLDTLDFLEFVLTDFGLEVQNRTKSGLLLQLNRWLLEQYRAQQTCVLLVDEAQDCSWDLLEEIRLLTNLETASEKLVQVVLVGQPELEDKLRQTDARQLRQRISLWCRTYPLTPAETAQYIRERLRIAGSTSDIFTDAAIATVYAYSGGVPRIINLLCEHALILSYVHQEKKVGAGAVEAVSRDLMIEPSQAESTEILSSEFADSPEENEATPATLNTSIPVQVEKIQTQGSHEA